MSRLGSCFMSVLTGHVGGWSVSEGWHWSCGVIVLGGVNYVISTRQSHVMSLYTNGYSLYMHMGAHIL